MEDKPKWPRVISCPQCGFDAICTVHEAQPIADQVMRTYTCIGCGHNTRKAFSIYEDRN